MPAIVADTEASPMLPAPRAVTAKVSVMLLHKNYRGLREKRHHVVLNAKLLDVFQG